MGDGYSGDGTRDLFSHTNSYMSPTGGFNIFSDEVGLHPSMDGLDLNSQVAGFPHLEEYQGYLRSDGVDAGNDGRRPPSGPRNGTGGANRTLGLRGARSTGGVGRGDSSGSVRLRRGPLPSLAPGGSGNIRSMSSVPMGSGRGGNARAACRDEGDDDGEDNGVEEVFETPQPTRSHKANWSSESNNKLLCELLVEQIELGNYIKGTMTTRGYNMIIQKFYSATNLRHDKKQIGNRIRQLKQQLQFIKDLHSNSGLGRDANGWPTATQQWWDDATEKTTEWRKFRWGPPEYLPLLEKIFDGVAVDGSSAHLPGQRNHTQDMGAQEKAHEDEDDDDDIEDASPMSSNSRKRGGSTSSTARSPSKKKKSPSTLGVGPSIKTKSPMVKVMKDYLTMSSRTASERSDYLKLACTGKQERKAELNAAIMEAQRLATESGVPETSPEYYALSEICKDECTRAFFMNMTTAEGRVAFLKRY